MTQETLALLTIFGMAGVTLATRWGGFWLLRRVEPGPYLRRVLDQVPGATFAALCATLLAEAGWIEWLAAGLVAAIMLRGGHLLLALAGGWALVAALRALVPLV